MLAVSSAIVNQRPWTGYRSMISGEALSRRPSGHSEKKTVAAPEPPELREFAPSMLLLPLSARPVAWIARIRTGGVGSVLLALTLRRVSAEARNEPRSSVNPRRNLTGRKGPEAQIAEAGGGLERAIRRTLRFVRNVLPRAPVARSAVPERPETGVDSAARSEFNNTTAGPQREERQAENNLDNGGRNNNMAPRSERQQMPRSERRSEAFGGDSVRISPPIVRERSERQSFSGEIRSAPQAAPRNDGGGGMRGESSGGQRGGMSAPPARSEGGGSGGSRGAGGGHSGGGGRGR